MAPAPACTLSSVHKVVVLPQYMELKREGSALRGVDLCAVYPS